MGGIPLYKLNCVERDTYLDSVKAVLIYLVILGHCIPRIGENSGYIASIFNVIYSFHMPLFVFVSGYFFNPNKGRSSIIKNCLELFSTFLLFQIIWTIISPPHSLSAVLTPAVTLWYLLCLIYWKLILFCIRDWINVKLLIVVVLISILAGFIPIGAQLSFQRFFTFFPFFVAGYLLRGHTLFKIKNYLNSWVAMGLLLAIIVGMSFFKAQWRGLLYGDRSYYDLPFNLAFAPVLRMCHYVLASILSILIITLIPDRRFLAEIGTKTMTIYLFHLFPIIGLRIMGVKTESIILLVTIALVLLLITCVLDRIPLIRWMTKPVKLKN